MVKFCLAKAVECRRAADLAIDPVGDGLGWTQRHSGSGWREAMTTSVAIRVSCSRGLPDSVRDTRRIDWCVGRPSLTKE